MTPGTPSGIIAASPVGLLIGALCGLIPLLIAFRYKRYRIGVGGFLACLFSGFACGALGGVPMILLASAVVISYVYVDRQDPFTSRESLENVDFSESNSEFFLRQMARLGMSLRSYWRGLTRNRAGFLGFLGLLFFFLLLTIGPLFIRYESAPQLSRAKPGAGTGFHPPSAEFPLGLDWAGRSVLSHMIYGGQPLIVTAIQAGAITTLIAVTLGALAALLGGVFDQVLSGLANFILTIPQFPLLIVLASIITFDNRLYLALLLGLLDWPVLMRAIRAQVLSLRERDFIQAAIALDLGLPHLIFREVLPNLISYIVVNMIFSIRAAVYALVGLTYLGMVPFKEPDWAVLILNARQRGAIFNVDAISTILSPILAIALFQLSLVLFTRSLEEIFNPRLRSGL
ncbi:MAG TPA: ABC transporter permease [Aggregatilineales bacterium]|nr:ABC transporter permease [Anaerolineales bacterium]HRE47535.1 ABC transporter permease [Aggregatilineales bacterium]